MNPEKRRVNLHVKCLLLLLDFNKKLTVPLFYLKALLPNFIQTLSSPFDFLATYGRTDGTAFVGAAQGH